MENTTTPTPPGLSFEEAFRRLEETAQTLEAGSLTLEEATGLYEEGMRLAKLCNQMLSSTQIKITQLRNAYAEYASDAASNDEDNIAPR